VLLEVRVREIIIWKIERLDDEVWRLYDIGSEWRSQDFFHYFSILRNVENGCLFDEWNAWR
jgi:hypothetical protein